MLRLVIAVLLIVGLATPALALKHGGSGIIPSTATDNFNRADGSLGANWVQSPSFSSDPVRIISNTAGIPTSTWAMAYWNPATNTFSNDHSSQVTFAGGTTPGAIVRHQSGVSNGYLALATTIGAGAVISVYRMDAGAFTLLNSSSSLTTSVGDILVVTATGTTITATLNGVTRATATDATYSFGSPGIATFNATVDNWIGSPIAGSGGGGDVAFTPTALRFMAPTGNDACDGTSPTIGTSGACAWATPNHAVNCGDVILAATGTYAGKLSRNFGAVSNCPSTSGGIDGTGQIWFAVVLCAGNLTTCKATGGPAVGWDFSQNNWAVEGFSVENNTSNRAFEVRNGAGSPATCTTAGNNHHIAAINNIAYNSDQGFGLNDGGCGSSGSNPPSADYIAVVGFIAQNAALDNICLGAVDLVGTGKSNNTTTDIKGIISGVFSYHNRNTNCDANFDTEGIMMDTPQTHSTNGIWNIYNNMTWDNARMGFQLQSSCTTNVPFTLNILNNTMYANNAGANAAGHPGVAGEINIQENSGCTGLNPIPVTVNINRNITLSKYTSSPTTGGTNIYAMFVDTSDGTQSSKWGLLTNGSTGSENIYKGLRTSCDVFNGGGCDAGFNIDWADPTSHLGTNFFTDPLFANVTDLLTNWVGAPNCSGFENTTQCMGYDAKTSTLTSLTPISNLQASCTNCGSKGYQLPSVTCTTDANYPTWLKGIVYLKASGFTAGATITQKQGLVTKPCGL